MGFANAYLNKQQHKNISIAGAPQGLLRYIIIIPAYCEPEIFKTLESIKSQKKVKGSTEVIILFNFSEKDKPTIKAENKLQYKSVLTWCSENLVHNINFIPLLVQDLRYKHAGVGMARKIAMDYAVDRFNQLNNPEGVILSVDADTTVPPDYLISIENHIEQYSKANTFIFNFAHEIEGEKYKPEIYQGAALYELHLRYYRRMLMRTGFPYPYFTIGSCFGIKAGLYVKVGGMNRKKAGEDFYFLQKVFPFGHVAFLNQVVLCPSSRTSWRVPFGTGPAIRKIVDSRLKQMTYNPKAFLVLKELFDLVPSLFYKDAINYIKIIDKLPPALRLFLQQVDFESKISEIRNNSSQIKSFTKRFFNWFDGFLVIKYLNFSKDKYFPELEIKDAIKEISGFTGNFDLKKALLRLRDMDYHQQG